MRPAHALHRTSDDAMNRLPSWSEERDHQHTFCRKIEINWDSLGFGIANMGEVAPKSILRHLANLSCKGRAKSMKSGKH